MVNRKEYPSITQTPLGAIGDAMMVVQSYFLAEPIFSPDQYTSEGLDEWLENLSLGKCEYASVLAIIYLNRHYRDLFSHMAIIKSESHKTKVFNGNGWDFHACFLVQDNTGIWHVGSPANYVRTERNNPLTEIVSSDNLGEIIKKIRTMYGGDWPSAEFIRRKFTYTKYRLPTTTEFGSTSCLSITRIERCGVDCQETELQSLDCEKQFKAFLGRPRLPLFNK